VHEKFSRLFALWISFFSYGAHQGLGSAELLFSQPNTPFYCRSLEYIIHSLLSASRLFAQYTSTPLLVYEYRKLHGSNLNNCTHVWNKRQMLGGGSKCVACPLPRMYFFGDRDSVCPMSTVAECEYADHFFVHSGMRIVQVFVLYWNTFPLFFWLTAFAYILRLY